MLKTETLGLKARKNLLHFYISFDTNAVLEAESTVEI